MGKDFGRAAFGEQLRREREQRGVPLEAICAVTKVPLRHIRSLESGALADLPGGVFRRGFVRSYLIALGLEESSWMNRFEESCRNIGLQSDPNDTAWTVFAENVSNNRVRPRRGRPLRWLWIGLVMTPVLIGGVAGTIAVRAHRPDAHSRRPWSSVKAWVNKVIR